MCEAGWGLIMCWKKITTVIAILLLGMIVLLVYFGKRNSRRLVELSARGRHLRMWHKEVASANPHAYSPDRALFEICKKRGQVPAVLVLDMHPEGISLGRLLADPNEFYRTVEYGFLIGHSGWFVKELRTGRYYPHTLMIDQDGHILAVLGEQGMAATERSEVSNEHDETD